MKWFSSIGISIFATILFVTIIIEFLLKLNLAEISSDIPVYVFSITTYKEVHKNKVYTYRKVSNIRCTKSPNLNDSRLVLQLSLSNILKPGIKSRMKMQLEQRRQAMLQLHLSHQQFNCLLKCVLY